MKRQIPGLHQATRNGIEFPDGLYLVRVVRTQYRWHPQKPFFALHFAVLEPRVYADQSFTGRLYCTPRALWKLNWFLHEFGYDTDLLGRDEIDEKALLGLRGVIRLSHTTLNGRSFLNLEGFAGEAEWEELSAACVAPVAAEEEREARDDL